jgi:hypothetical protein
MGQIRSNMTKMDTDKDKKRSVNPSILTEYPWSKDLIVMYRVRILKKPIGIKIGMPV